MMVRDISVYAAASVALALATPALALDTFVITYQLPGVQASTAGFDVVGVEGFDALATGTQDFSTDFGTGGAITATYSGVQVSAADQYGGAGGDGNYAVAFGSSPYTLTLTSDPVLVPNGINYFGYWLSALDTGNVVDFYRGATLVGTLNPASVLAATSGKPGYFGNPDAPFTGQNNVQPYVFINFFDTSGTFDRIVFRESPAVGGYESDNHTVGFFTDIGGIGVPEPTAWAMMIVGWALVGFAARRRRAAVAV